MRFAFIMKFMADGRISIDGAAIVRRVEHVVRGDGTVGDIIQVSSTDPQTTREALETFADMQGYDSVVPINKASDPAIGISLAGIDWEARRERGGWVPSGDAWKKKGCRPPENPLLN